MRRAALTLISVLPASEALADPGGHVHPHGSEIWFAVLGAAAALGAVGLIRVASAALARAKAGK
ncbi:hypothetical protein OEW28_08660 [Defluviimonas sp. WL0002]|uniref:Peptidase M23 n=1 Tax=Albidovulum marisflavi TaxID=2984159 RepID=A0ABT2ZC92_9RHOB|nr:hypothetical protein [Defluviimonas sp. WL0002]MCV2868698.1 hypothetical protein [Defluviimonas sp. WL0002]